MFANYALSAVRAVQRDPWHAAVNVAGLAVALAASLLIALYVRHELSYENFFTDPEQVYRVESEFTAPGLPAFANPTAPYPLPELLVSAFEGRLWATRLIPAATSFESDSVRIQSAFKITDPSLPDVLDFQVAAGDLNAALRAPDAIVLTRRMALRLFGEAAPVGETLRVADQFDLRVAAVLEDPPANTRFDFDILASVASPSFGPTGDMSANWNDWQGEVFVRLGDELSAEALHAQLPGLVERHRPESADGSTLELSLRPLQRIHLAENADGAFSDRLAITLLALSAAGVFVIFIACFSYINLATVRSLLRVKEVGLRKIVGGRMDQLALQFFAESFAITLAAFCLGALAAAVALPAFANLVDRPLRLADALSPDFGVWAICLLGAVALAAGVYPALVLAAQKPAWLFKSGPRSAGAASFLRTGVVSVQFGLTAALLITAVVAYAQVRHLKTFDLGFEPRGLVVFPLSPAQAQNDADLVFRDELARSPYVEAATARAASPREAYEMYALPFSRSVDGGDPVGEVLGMPLGDGRFFDVYEIEPLAGRLLSEERGADHWRLPTAEQPVVTSSVVLSESAVGAYGFSSAEAALGQALHMPLPPGRLEFTVVGVVPDAHLRLARKRNQPTVYALTDDAGRTPAFFEVAARVREGAEQEALAEARRIWSELYPDALFAFEFLEDRIAGANADDERLSRLLAVFAGLSMFVACLGLFALASFVAAQRAHEIAVRKVLGASTGGVTRLLVWDFAKPVLLAHLIAWPLAWVMARSWLDRFAYRIELSPAFFLGVSAAALAVALLAIVVRAYAAARLRPAAVLRDE